MKAVRIVVGAAAFVAWHSIFPEIGGNRNMMKHLIPENIRDAIILIRALEKKIWLTHAEKGALNQARLKVAFWDCRRKGVYAGWNSLCHAIGVRPEAIRPTYERMFGSAEPK